MMAAGIDAATMEPLDKRLYAAAEKEFKERALDRRGMLQLDGGTFISRESFDGICGDQRAATWHGRTKAEPARLVSAWDDHLARPTGSWAT